MYFSAALALIPFLASSAAGLPVRRQAAANSSDLLVLKFANVLEQLETTFYTQALQKFQASDFLAAGFSDASVPVQQFQAIMSDESTHTTILASTIQSLGDTAISGCSFDFSTVLASVTTMAPVARLVENVGVGAYLGAARLITDPVILTDAASIVTVEARHQTILNLLNGGTAIPSAFDIPLLPQEVLAIAGSFISGCSVGIDALPALTVTNTGTVGAGTSLSFSFAAQSSMSNTSALSCQMLAGGMPFSLSLPYSQCVVPAGLNGPVAIYVTNDTQPLNNNVRDRFTGNIVAGPTMAFIDGTPDALGNLARTVSGASNSTSGSNSTNAASSAASTSTITPDAASSIVASASASATAAAPAGSGSAMSGMSGMSGSALPPTANSTTGPSKDGAVMVNGWSSVPAPGSSSPAAASSAPAAASSAPAPASSAPAAAASAPAAASSAPAAAASAPAPASSA
ncbi:ferritin-like domain-containing protein [Phellopilus nigrolimitatus]|nr:ferritin-like domain-containing protein [Phellopilus nigrolimitatus]